MKYCNMTITQASMLTDRILGNKSCRDVCFTSMIETEKAFHLKDWKKIIELEELRRMRNCREDYSAISHWTMIAKIEIDLTCTEHPKDTEYNGLVSECDVCRHNHEVSTLVDTYERLCKALKEMDLGTIDGLYHIRQSEKYGMSRYFMLTYHLLNKAMEGQDWPEVLRLTENISLLNPGDESIAEMVMAAEAGKESL